MKNLLSKEHLISTFLMTLWLTICTAIFYKLHIHDTWPAYLAVVFFFTYEFNTAKLKAIFGGGVMGILYGFTIPIALGALTPIFGAELGYYIFIFVVLLTIIGLGPISHSLFNSSTFCYSLLCLIHAKEVTEHGFTWIMITILGGALCLIGIYGVVKMMHKNTSNDTGEAKTTH